MEDLICNSVVINYYKSLAFPFSVKTDIEIPDRCQQEAIAPDITIKSDK